MTALNNRVGPTRIWKTVNCRNVKSNDGKDVGKIKKVSENYLLLQKGKVRKHRFWIPKYIADAFDGKTLWLLLSEVEVRGKYQYGKEPPAGEKYSREFESFKGTPFGQKVKYGADFEENIRIVENYNNIRDLHKTTSFEGESKYLKTLRQGHGLRPRSEEEQTHAQQEVVSSKENERKEKHKHLETEGVHVTEYASKQPIKFGSPKILERTVQRFPPYSKSAAPKIGVIKSANNASSGPIRFQPSQITERLKEATKDGGRKKSINDNSTDLSPVRRTSEAHVPIQTVATTPTAIAHSSVMSSGLSSPLPIHTTDKHKETIQNLSALDLGSTQMPMKADDNTVSNSTTENTAMMVATSTYIMSDKKIDTIPVLVDPMPKLAKVKEEEQHIIAVSEKNNESNLPALNIQTLTPTSLETESNSSNPISSYSDHNNQLTSRNEGRTNITKNVNSILDYYFNPFLATWQTCLDIYNEFAAIGTRLSLNWFELLWKLGTPTIQSARETDDNNKV